MSPIVSLTIAVLPFTGIDRIATIRQRPRRMALVEVSLSVERRIKGLAA